MAFILMLLDVAWILFGWACLQEGVREGVRFAVTGTILSGCTSHDASIKEVVRRYSFGFAGSSNQCGASASASPVHVDYYTQPDLSPCPGAGCNIAPNVVKISATGISAGTFGAIFRHWTPITLAASSSDVMENGTAPPR
jgi:hypothetical protein